MFENNSNCSLADLRYPLFKITYSLVLALGLPLNAVALWMFLRRLCRSISVPVIYMTNLALSDLLFVLSLPFRILYFSTGRWTLGDVACMIPGTLFSVNLYSSSFFIMLVSVDRMLALAYPLRSRSVRTPTVAWITCLAVWIVIGTLAVPVALNHRANNDTQCGVQRCFEHYSEENWRFGFFILCIVTTVGILLPFCIILACTVVVVRQLRGIAVTSALPSSTEVSIKMVWLLLSNLLIYAICFIPFHAVFILYGLQKLNVFQYFHNLLTVQTVTMCLASTNSCLDPLVYYFSTRSLKRKNSCDSQKTKDHKTCQTYYSIPLRGLPED
ncbi:lysophosphatidic acid receptor 5a [Astyanax mexicanus]|uniref:Lysophosphatidic acid receptor 6-like n=1 Tax=Astyanax mexicanus TaxID=7994 RepID=A0A8B9HT85_ASTMX|nr:lysophosphatidic acid receptor 5a [Astyanax mexicanus]KAG9278598.1 lysophosphatidic acid receptor 6-like [Astyanax mexicanus]